MRPLTVLTGFLLGSSASITFSLAAVLVVFVILSDDYPRLAHEFEALLESLLIFLVLTGISAMSFYTLQKEHAARWWWQAGMWLAILLTGAWFWPR